MEIEALRQAALPLLENHGFELSSEYAAGQDRQYLYSDGAVEVEFLLDRTQVFVGVGLPGSRALDYRAWANAIGIPFVPDLDLFGQLEYFIANLEQIREFVATNPDADARVSAENVKLLEL